MVPARNRLFRVISHELIFRGWGVPIHRCPRPQRTCRSFAFRTLSRILCSTACRPATTRSDRTQFAPSYSTDWPIPAYVSTTAFILQFNISERKHPPRCWSRFLHFCRFRTMPCSEEPGCRTSAMDRYFTGVSWTFKTSIPVVLFVCFLPWLFWEHF